MRIRNSILPWLSVLGLSATLVAQTAPQGAKQTTAPVNLIRNGGFEATFRGETAWNGTDINGFLIGQRGSAPILAESGSISDSQMPISVAAVDMNRDGLLDIVMSDVLGYVRIFFNSGSTEQPAFTAGELADVFLSRVGPKEPTVDGAHNPYARRVVRIYPTNIMRSGKKDLIIGNYLGEILLLPNLGTDQRPSFKQPSSIAQLAIPTTKEPNRIWGNVFAPCTWDWNGDGRDDLLLGEGSYSANNIHLLTNRSSGAKPAFEEDGHFILAYGDGLEQLTPTVVDYNGDGLPDVLSTERKGRIAVFLNTGKKTPAGEPPAELPFASFISNGASSQPLTMGGISTIATGDFNGDGLFDLLIGKSNGRIALSLNTGTKESPKFDMPTDVKGTPTLPLAMPSGWAFDAGLGRGNFYGFISAVDVAQDGQSTPAEGKIALKLGYQPSINKIMAAPTSYFPGFPLQDGALKPQIFGPSNLYYLSCEIPGKLKMNTTYILTFKVKGTLSEGKASVKWSGGKRMGEDRVIKEDRNAAKIIQNVVREDKMESLTFSGGTAWLEVRKEFRITFNKPELKDMKDASADLDLTLKIPPGSNAYLDDFKLVEKL